jgi:hypothetical protein
MEEYKSEFHAPSYSVVSVETAGTMVVRTVIMDGEIMEFVASRALVIEGRNIGGSTTQETVEGDGLI